MSAKRAVIAGIPGVGKTTVITRVRELLVRKGVAVEHVVFGTIMLEEAKKLGITDRDRMRTLPMSKQKELQIKAASSIAQMTATVTLIDTHLFIRIRAGYLPGLPADILTTLAPTNLFLIEASVADVISRRSSDTTRNREMTDVATIEMEIRLARGVLAASSVISGCPIKIVRNENNMVDPTADEVFQALLE